MGATSVTPIVLGFVLGIIPFTLWTWWMIHQERSARENSFVATADGRDRQLPPSGEALVRTARAQGVRPRWRREQTAA